jgi:hypothetical protein
MNIFTTEQFLVAFLSTLMASLTVIFLQVWGRDIEERRKKLYAIAHITDISYRVLNMSLFLKKNTLIPHIKAAQLILKGDADLLRKMFLADEFDILTDKPISFNSLPEEYKVLLGFDDINLIRAYETMVYDNENNATKMAFNEFVKENLKSQHLFSQMTAEKQQDVISVYWDYLDKLKHQADRISWFVLDVLDPIIREYIKRKQFIFFPKSNIKKHLERIESTSLEFKEFLPEKNFIENIMTGGIQRIVK